MHDARLMDDAVGNNLIHGKKCAISR